MAYNWRLGLSFSLITAVFWGLLPLALKSLLEQMDAVTITWFRFSAAALIAWAWYGRNSMAAIKRLCRMPLLPFTCITVFGLLGNYITFVYGLSYTTPAAAELIINTSPLLLLLGSIFLFKESFSRQQWLGVLLFIVGMLLFFHHRLVDLVSTEPGYMLGIGITFVSALLWTAYGLCQKKLIQSEKSNDVLLLIYFCGGLLYLPFSEPLAFTGFGPVMLALLIFASLNTIIAYGSFGLALTYWDASRVSAVISLAPLITLGAGALFNVWWPGSVEVEPMNALNWLGGMLVVLGSLLTSLSGRS